MRRCTAAAVLFGVASEHLDVVRVLRDVYLDRFASLVGCGYSLRIRGTVGQGSVGAIRPRHGGTQSGRQFVCCARVAGDERDDARVPGDAVAELLEFRQLLAGHAAQYLLILR